MSADSIASKWPKAKLVDVAAKQKHALAIGPFGSDLKVTDYRDHGVPIVFVRDVQPNGFSPKRRQYLSADKARQLAAHAVRAGDLVVTKMGLPPCVAAVYPSNESPGIVTADIIKFTVNQKMAIPDYVARCINSDLGRGQVAKITFGITRPKVTLRDFRELEIPLPPLAEQRRIAEVLDRAEALRTKRRAALAQLDTLAQSIFLDLFGDPVSNSKNFPSARVLGDVADLASGITKGRVLRGQSTRAVPYLAVANVQDKELELSVVKEIEASEDEIDRYRLVRDDLLLTEGGDPDKLGRGTLWREELPECIHQNHIFRVRLRGDELDPFFLNWLVGSQRGKRYFLKSAKQTTGIASINMGQLKKFPLLIPPLPLQKDFARRIAAVEKLKSAQRASLAELDALFASLQHRAFRGEL